jgi:hypothetical protein
MERTIASLITEVENGQLALPEFQRDYKWPVENVEELLRSIGQSFPIGTLLLLNQEESPKSKLQPRKIAGGPGPKAKPRFLLLDGQQRLTALYAAYHDLGDQIYLIDLKAVKKSAALLDDCVTSVSRKNELKVVGTIQDRRDKHQLTMQEVYSDAHFTAWLSDPVFSDAQREQLAELRQKHLAIFREHTVTCEVVSGKLPISAIAKVFERTNRRVLRLNAFDLMVAVMWPKGFKLRTKWDAAKTANPILKEYGTSGLDILRLLALREYLHEKKTKPEGSALRVTGIRQSDVLEVPPAVVKRDWDSAVRAFVRALEFSKAECGVVRRSLMPNVTMWIPLADGLWRTVPKKGTERYGKVTRWFWSATFTRQYARGANTRATSDGESLRGWLGARSKEQPPDYVKRFRVDESDLSDAAEEGNDIVVRGLVCLLNTKGARDWATSHKKSPPPKLLDIQSPLAIHHVFPKKFLSQRQTRLTSADAPANQVLITSTLNGKLNNQPPEYAATSNLVDRSAFQSHAVDAALLKGNSYGRFVKARAKALANIINQFVQ